VLEDLTQELSQLPVAGDRAASEPEARAVLAAMLGREVAPATLIATDAEAAAAGRGLLTELLAHEVVGAEAQALVAAPPRDVQLGVDPGQLMMVPVVLSALVGWLQTKVRFTIRREFRGGSFEVEIEKQSADPETLRNVTATLAGLMPKSD
jgi:hypothetical protein